MALEYSRAPLGLAYSAWTKVSGQCNFNTRTDANPANKEEAAQRLKVTALSGMDISTNCN
jgi:hypothetical protein